MKNFIFISPNFPTNYWQFCRELKNNGLNVLGIGDQPYDELKPELKDSLNEYYKGGSLENYDEVYRAVAFFAFKYGRIDWLESNNEYWLERDAALRTDFHITSGFQTEDMPRIKYKSKMKEYYQKAGIATARYHMVDDFEGCKKFIDEVGYPIVVKPDNGVGASDTHKLSDDEELRAFLTYKSAHHADVSYIMEEFVRAEVNSYDAIIDGSGNPIFEAGNVSPMSIMDIVNNDDNSIYYIIKDLPEDIRTKFLGLSNQMSDKLIAADFSNNNMLDKNDPEDDGSVYSLRKRLDIWADQGKVPSYIMFDWVGAAVKRLAAVRSIDIGQITNYIALANEIIDGLVQLAKQYHTRVIFFHQLDPAIKKSPPSRKPTTVELQMMKTMSNYTQYAMAIGKRDENQRCWFICDKCRNSYPSECVIELDGAHAKFNLLEGYTPGRNGQFININELQEELSENSDTEDSYQPII